MVTNLERLLRGDKATYKGNPITLVIQHPNAPEGDTRNISVFDKKDESIRHFWFSAEEINYYTDFSFLTPDRPRTIEDGLRKGDVIMGKDGDKRKILAVIDDIHVVSFVNVFDRISGLFTLQELIKGGWKLVAPEEEKKEESKVYLTFEDISAGKGVGIAPERICIIDQNKQ